MNHPHRWGTSRSHRKHAKQLKWEQAAGKSWFEALEARVLLSGSIAGRVFLDGNASGAKDGSETDTPNITVYLDANNNGQLDDGETSTATDAGGNYSFTGLGAGTFTVGEVAPTGFLISEPATPFSYSVVLVADQNATGEDFGNYPAATIRGTIFLDSNDNGTQDAGEVGRTGITVFFDVNSDNPSGPAAGEIGAVTDTDGNFTLNGVAAGTGTLTEVLDTGFVASAITGSTAALTITPGQTVTAQNFGNYQNSAITGQVFNDLNANGVKESSDAPLAGAVVYLDTNNNATLDNGEVSTVSDVNGLYGFTGLAAGTYTVREIPPAGDFTTKPASPFSYSVTLNATQTVTTKDFGNYAPASITGRVFVDTNANGLFDAGETGLQGVTVFFDTGTANPLAPAAGEVSAVTDANGNYTLSGLAAGTGTLRELRDTTAFPGVVPSTGTFALTLTPGLALTENFGNFTNDSITGQIFNDFNANGVKDSDDTAAAGITVYLDINNNALQDAGDPATVTDANGNYGFTGLADGTYTVREALPANTLISTPAAGSYLVTLSSSGTTSSTANNFGNFPSNAILGQIYNDANKNGVKNTGEAGRAGVTVYFDANNNGVKDDGEVSTTTNANGNYTLVVPAGATGDVRQVSNLGFLESSPTGNVYSVHMTAGQTIKGKDFGTYQITTDGSTSINGHIFIDNNGNGVEDPGDGGASGITVFVKQGGNVLASILTDAHGNYSFNGAPAGNYTIGQVLPDGVFQVLPAQGDVPVSINIVGQSIYANFADRIIGPDLIVALTSAKFGKVASPTLLTPGDTVTLTFTVTNEGDRSASGRINFNVYASLNPVFAANDKLLFQLPHKRLALAAGKSKTYTIKVKVPAGLAPGSYYFTGQVVDVATISETNTANNTGTALTPTTVSLQFGTFQDHPNTKLTWLTSDGNTLATVKISGGGSGQLTPNGDGAYNLQITNASAKSVFTITTDRHSTAPLLLNNITTNSGLTGFIAKTTDVEGDMTITGGGLTTLALRNISLGNTFTIGGDLGTFTAASVYGLSLNVTGHAIKTVDAVFWNGGSIQATTLGTMSVTGQRATKTNAAIAGDLTAAIVLSANVAQKPTLGSLTVAGKLSGSFIRSSGNIGTVKVGAMFDSDIYAGVDTLNFPALPDLTTDYTDPAVSIGSLTVAGLTPGVASFVRSHIAAGTLTSIKLAKIDNTAPGADTGSLFGVAGKTITLLSYLNTAGAKVTLTNVTSPTDPQLTPYPDGVFSVIVPTTPPAA